MDDGTGWQLDLDGAWNYERFLVPALMQPGAARLTELAGVGTGQRVLDVACGTGVVARSAAERVGPSGAVAALDVNPAMLAVAAEVAGDVEPTIRWEEAPAESLPFDAASFDHGFCQQGLQFLTDRHAALAELHRVLAPGGALAVSTCRSIAHQPAYAVLADVVTEHVGVQAGSIIRSPYSFGEPEELRAAVEKAGFDAVHVRIDITPLRVPSARALLEGETTSSPLGDIVDALDPDLVEVIVGDLAGRLAPHTDDDGIVFPFETVILTAAR